MAKLTPKKIEERLKNEYPRGVDLVFADYRDSLDEAPETIEEILQTGFCDSVDIYNWFWEAQDYAIDNILQEVFDEEEQEEIRENEELWKAFRDWCFENDTSDPIRDVIRNTSSRYFFYDLGHQVARVENSRKATEEEAKRIAKKLRLPLTKNKWIYNLVAEAYSGGDLVIICQADIIDFYGEIKEKYIKFKSGFDVAIINRVDGSGCDTSVFDVKPPELIVEFDRKKLHDDIAAPGYSYTSEVCGWLKAYDNTDFELTDKPGRKPIVLGKYKTEMEMKLKREEELERRWRKEGKCIPGDMNFNRHPKDKIVYINDFPCGHKCLACGTFWID